MHDNRMSYMPPQMEPWPKHLLRLQELSSAGGVSSSSEKTEENRLEGFDDDYNLQT